MSFDRLNAFLGTRLRLVPLAGSDDLAIRGLELESICKHICEERGAPYDDSGDLAKLYKAAAAAMDIAPDQHTEQITKQILSGVGTVVNGLAAMRNSLSDSHGRGKASVRPAPRHAKLAVNAGFAVAGFLIDTHIEKPKRSRT